MSFFDGYKQSTNVQTARRKTGVNELSGNGSSSAMGTQRKRRNHDSKAPPPKKRAGIVRTIHNFSRLVTEGTWGASDLKPVQDGIFHESQLLATALEPVEVCHARERR